MRRILFILVLLLVRASAQEARITEFLALNTSGAKDEDGTYQGWIELWNPSTTTKFSLSGWRLINSKPDNSGAVTWTFPSVEIMPDERMIIWASGKNRTVVTNPLHTNFTLYPTGGNLTLQRFDLATISIFANYPAQSADVSYGRDESDTSPSPTQVGFYTNPSSGDRNNYTGTGVAGKVTFDKTSRAYTGTLILTLTQTTPEVGAVIKYTTNGSMPSNASTTYTAPFVVASTQVVRARVFKPGKLPGETETNGYLLLDGTTSTFSSAMPIMVLTNFQAGAPAKDILQNSFVWLWEPAAPDNRARFTNTPTFFSRTAIEIRGSSTAGNPKYNLNMECRKNRDDDDRNVSILGMAAESDWILGAPWDFDRSDLHNPFIYTLSRNIGRYASDTRQVEMFIDINGSSLNFTGGASGDYFGIYNFTEKIRRADKRVDVTKLDTYDNDAVKKTGGYIWKIDRRDTGDNGFAAGGFPSGSGQLGPSYYYPKEREILSPQRDPQEQYLTAYVNSFYSALNSANFTDPVVGYAAWIDVPGAIDHHLLNVWPMNVDALRLSGYWYKERGGKLVPGPIWDYDRTMESNDARDDEPRTWRSIVSDFGTDFFNYPWWNRMFQDIEFYQKYIDRWVELRRGPFSQNTVNALLDTLNGTISAEAVTRDLARWGKVKRTNTFPGSPAGSYPATQAGEVQRIKDWLQVRATWMETQWVTPVTLSVPSGTITPGQSVTMTGPAGATIYYTLDGTDPRPSGGGVPAGANVFVYSSPITINATTMVKARAYNASWTALTGANNPPLVSKWSGLTFGRYSTDPMAAPGDLLITEVNYHPAGPTAAELAINPTFDNSDFEFVEIKNVGATAVNMDGVYFGTGVGFTIPVSAAITLAPGQFAIVCSNPQAFVARYGSKPNLVGPYLGDLDDDGEQIVLKSASNAVLQDFTYTDDWYPTTDGDGYSLAIYKETAGAAAYSTAAGWNPSHALGGSPGADEGNFAPMISAGADVTGNVPSIALTGTADDDGKPGGPITLSWSKQSGPGDTSFSSYDTLSTTATVTLPGVYALRLSGSDSLLTTNDDVIVTMRDTPGAWLLRHPGIGTLNDDPDGDGRINFYEWALLMDPSVPTGTDGSVTQVVNDHLTITYNRQKNSPFVSYVVQVTNDFTSWADPQPGDVTEVILNDDGITQTVRATDNTAMSSQPHRFIRLKVTPL
jgi:hypothetical protein